MPPETGLTVPLGDTHARCVHCKIYARAVCVDAFVQRRPELIIVIRRRVYTESELQSGRKLENDTIAREARISNLLSKAIRASYNIGCMYHVCTRACARPATRELKWKLCVTPYIISQTRSKAVPSEYVRARNMVPVIRINFYRENLCIYTYKIIKIM